jgi:hypothetical protein
VNQASGRASTNCRNLLTSSRVRRQKMAEKLDQQWNELRRIATIERDPQRLAQLTSELDRRQRQAAFELQNRRSEPPHDRP